jgi:hypothetical protein
MLGSNLPGIVTFKTPKRMALDGIQQGSMRFGGPIKIKSGTADSGHTGQTNILRPGGIFVEETGSTGYYVPVNEWVSVAKGTAAVITSAEDPDADWASKVIKLFRNGVQVASVTLGAGDDTTSEVVTALNADASFRNNAIASGADLANLVITDVVGLGALTVEINLLSAYATANGAASSVGHAVNVIPDVRVIGESVCMTDSAGSAAPGECTYNFTAGHFRGKHLIVGGTVVAALTDIPAFARAILEARGSTFTL